MLPVLMEMAELNLISWDEAVEANAHRTSNPEEWFSMPQPLMDRLFAAYALMMFDEERATLH